MILDFRFVIYGFRSVAEQLDRVERSDSEVEAKWAYRDLRFGFHSLTDQNDDDAHNKYPNDTRDHRGCRCRA